MCSKIIIIVVDQNDKKMMIADKDKIKEYFSEQPECLVKNMLLVTQAIFGAKSPNLNKAKDHVRTILDNESSTKIASNYTRLIRFFSLQAAEQAAEQAALSQAMLGFIFSILPKSPSKPLYLVLDGTSWELGAKKIHLLTLSVVIAGVSIPLCWEDLDKEGASNFEERKKLLDRACEQYDLKGMILIADREYIGLPWFKYLKSKHLEFVIRLKKGVYKARVDEQREGKHPHFKHQKDCYTAMERQAKLSKYQHVGVAKQIVLEGDAYSFVVFKNPKKEANEDLIYFISSLQKKQKIVHIYPIRWTIECCFKHLKSNGFHLEEINFKQISKIKMMMTILVFLYGICIYQGLFPSQKERTKPIYKKYAKGKTYLAVSIFRTGLSIVTGRLTDFKAFLNFLTHLLSQLRKPYWVYV